MSIFDLIGKLESKIRLRIGLFIAGLIFSGLTAFPIEWELLQAHRWIARNQWDNAFTQWLELAYQGIAETNVGYPFISYGSDWLGLRI